jgi:hypothetical protein
MSLHLKIDSIDFNLQSWNLQGQLIEPKVVLLKPSWMNHGD